MTPDDLQVQACEFWQQFPPEERPGEGERVELVRNKAGEIIEGSASEVKRQRDTWTFARRMGVQDPNWQLVATGD